MTPATVAAADSYREHLRTLGDVELAKEMRRCLAEVAVVLRDTEPTEGLVRRLRAWLEGRRHLNVVVTPTGRPAVRAFVERCTTPPRANPP